MQSLIDALHRIAAALRRGPIAIAACALLAGLVLLPGLGGPGLWDPQERQLADRIAPPVTPETAVGKLAAAPNPVAEPACLKAPPKDAAARSLTARAVVAGRDHIADSDAGRRLPLALLGLVTVLAAAGIAMRGGGARAGVVAAAVLLAMPLLGLQTRMLTSDIGTACGAALIVYALFALADPHKGSVLALGLDLACSMIALTAGLVVGFYGGGALLGLVVPIGAVAAAGGLGVPLVRAAVARQPIAPHLPGLVATLVVGALVGLLAYQLYDLREPALAAGMVPAARQVAGHAIVGEGCYSWALGGVWRVDDDLRFVFDSSFEQIAYGTYPWGILAPIAMVSLLRDERAQRRAIGAITLAWVGGAWLAAEVMHRKGGTMTLWAGFPAMAVAIGVWIDGVLARRAATAETASEEPRTRGGTILLGLFVVLAALTFGKDIQSFTEKLSSLVMGSEVTYPAASRLLGLKTKAWVLLLGIAAAGSLAVALGVWQPGGHRAARRSRQVATIAATLALLLTVALGLFWTLGWHRRLSVYLSSKTLFETVADAHKPGDQLVLMGDLGLAPRAYAPKDMPPELLANRAQVVAALKRPNRVFAITPLVPAESCALHRDMGETPYFVVDDRSLKSLLLSNQLGELADKNPLRTLITRTPPAAMRFKPASRIVWDNKIELLGWDLPAKLERGDKLEVVTYYKILGDVGGNWTMLTHIDGPGGRVRGGDHKPIKDRCPTSTWKTGDYITDRHTMATSGGSYSPGAYDVWLGFFTGSSPSFKNMTLSMSPEGMRDANDRAKVTKLVLD